MWYSVIPIRHHRHVQKFCARHFRNDIIMFPRILDIAIMYFCSHLIDWHDFWTTKYNKNIKNQKQLKSWKLLKTWNFLSKYFKKLVWLISRLNLTSMDWIYFAMALGRGEKLAWFSDVLEVSSDGELILS